MRRNNNTPRGRGGPLMTEHLQLQDLDLELELLKRKREIIEQQQQILTNNQPFNRPRPFDYGNNQPRPLFPEQPQPFSDSSSFSRFYDGPRKSQGFASGSLLGKRPSDSPVWQTHSAPKRFSGPQGGPKKKFGGGPSPGPKPNNPRQQGSNFGSYSHKSGPRQVWDNEPKPFGAPKSTFPSQRFNNNPKGSKPQQKDFKPNKVTKFKPPTLLGKKFDSHPAPERKKPVQKTTKSKEDEFTGDQYILRSDTVPSQQMAGRLELALGNISKEIKEKYSSDQHVALFQSQYLNRTMKQAIRERLRGAMMGKPVGKVNSIVEHYRKVFPPDTDSEILDIVQAEQQNINKKQLAIKLESADTAFRYLRINMNKLIGVTLDDMFAKVQKLYENDENIKNKDICDEIISKSIDFTKDVVAGEADKSDSMEEIKDEGDESKVKVDENAENSEEQSKISNDPSEDKAPASDKPSNETPTADEKPAIDTQQLEEEIKLFKGDEKSLFQKPEWKKVDDLVVTLIKRRLPFILPKFKPQLTKLINSVHSYRVTKTAILDKTQSRIDLDNRIEQAEKSFNSTVDLSGNDDTAVTSTPNQSQTGGRFTYMVKILGRPVLPKRKVMQTFLDEFKPVSVKKHRNMHLLFVAFNNQEAYDKIVAVKETKLGNCSISIKVNEKPADKPIETVNNSATVELDSPEKIIGSDLDEQINDLLSSIRKEEEDPILDSDVEIVPESDNPITANETVPTEKDNEAANGTETTNGKKEADEINQKSDEIKNSGNVENVELEGNVENVELEGNAENVELDGNDENVELVGNGENVKLDDNDKNVELLDNDKNVELDDKVENEEVNDKVEELKADAKESGRATPTRASSRLANATPSSIKTRRASRLAQN